MKGTHIVTEDEDAHDLPYVKFKVPMIVSGDGREMTIVEGCGFLIHGEKDQKITFIDLTVHATRAKGLWGCNGMSFDCRRLRFDQCGCHGVDAWDTKGRLTNCQVTNCGRSGIASQGGSTIEIEGEETRINNNCNNGGQNLFADTKSCFIHLLSPLTKEDVSKNNNDKRWYAGTGGENYGGDGTIETVNSF